MSHLNNLADAIMGAQDSVVLVKVTVAQHDCVVATFNGGALVTEIRAAEHAVVDAASYRALVAGLKRLQRDVEHG